jgi:hypothetical protein
MDVTAWLRRLGLEQYEDTFRRNGVDSSVLTRLTPEDLRDLGVAAVGDRRKLIDAIAALSQAEAAPLRKGSAIDLAPGERRQVTVMFADLCGFTKLSREIDAEELHAVLGLYFEAVCAWRVLAVKDRSAHRPLIGRRAEIAQFIASAEACLSDRRGRVICIRGEAGIGKSRLAQAFGDEAVSLGFACHASRVLDFGSRTGHDALRTLLRDLLAIDTGALEDKRTQLTRLVETGFLAKDSIVFLPDLLAIDPLPSERALQTAMDMAARTEGRREAIRQIVQHASDSCPRMLICEDIHWADDELLGDLASIGAAVNDCPALLVVTCRPETDKLDHE